MYFDVGEEVILVPHVGVEVARLGAIEDKEVGVLRSLLYQNLEVQVWHQTNAKMQLIKSGRRRRRKRGELLFLLSLL